jgi:hypothetical protein
LSNYTFDGARADLSKTLSQVPAFQVTHSFALGSNGGPMGGISPGTYNFGAVYATSKVRVSITNSFIVEQVFFELTLTSCFFIF